MFQKELTKAYESAEKSALCIIVNTKGSTPRKMGAKMIVYESGKISGTIGGGNLEKRVIENALLQIKENKPKLFKHKLLQEHQMCCGGNVFIYIEPMKKKKQLYIFGAGHTGAALVTLAKNLDFNITLIDDRAAYLDTIETLSIHKISGHHNDILPTLTFDKNTYIVILTYDHSYDRDILAHCIRQPHAYLGMIGSQRKIEKTKSMLIEANLATQEELAKTDMPLGLKINANSPSEIAISILAKLIAIKNQSDIAKK